MPYFQRLMKEGIRGNLRSAFPPITPTAWSAMATGKNPGKTGIFDFYNRMDKESLKVRSINSADLRRAGTYWDYLSDAGYRVGVLNYPFLYPPYKITGFMVSGFGCSPDDEITYPKEIKQQIINACNGYQIDMKWASARYFGNVPLFVKEVKKLLEINQKAIEFLLKRDMDLSVAVIQVTDYVLHYMWKFFDDAHPLYREDEAQKYYPAYRNLAKSG